jgi:hypothetical protein
MFSGPCSYTMSPVPPWLSTPIWPGRSGAGRSIEEVLADYPYLEREDVLQALRYAAWRAEEREHIEAVHWSEAGPVGAEDTEIMAYAAQHDCVVSTSAQTSACTAQALPPL